MMHDFKQSPFMMLRESDWPYFLTINAHWLVKADIPPRRVREFLFAEVTEPLVMSWRSYTNRYAPNIAPAVG